jgi:hypothetical protein
VVFRYHIKLVADRLQACSFRLEHIPKVVRFDGGGIDKRWEGSARTDEAFDIEADVRPYAQALPENKGAASKAIAGSLLPPSLRLVPRNKAGKAPRNLLNSMQSTSPRRLARPRTSPFHGGNTGSNPVGDANFINYLRNCWFWRTTGYATVELLDHSTMGIALLFRHRFIVDIHRD